MMRITTVVCCTVCDRQLKAIIGKEASLGNESRAETISFCSVICFQKHLEHNKGQNQDHKLDLPSLKDPGLQVSLEECANKSQAEFIFFLHLLRAISDCDIVKLILSRENLLQRLQKLQGVANKRPLADLVFSTDIMKLALNIQMPAEKISHVISRLWEIASEARDKLQCMDEDIGVDEHIDCVDREIFQAIAKTTIDNILELGSNRFKGYSSAKEDMNEANVESQTSGKEHMVTEPLSKDRTDHRGLYFLDLEDDPLKSISITVRDNGSVLRKFKILVEESGEEEITFQSIANCITREDLRPGLDFIFLKKIFTVALDGEEEPGDRFQVISFSESVLDFTGEEIHLAHSSKPSMLYHSQAHVIVHLLLSAEHFVRRSDYFFYLQGPFEMVKVQEVASRLLTREYLHPGCSARLKLDIKGVVDRITALRDLCVSHMADHKVLSIEVLPADIIFEAEDEETIYSKEELDYFKTCEQEVRTERFLLTLAQKAGLEMSELKLSLKGILGDCSLFRYEEEKANRLRVYRCLRVARLLTRLPARHSCHDLSFVFGGQYGVHENQNGYQLGHLHRAFPPTQVLEYDLQPEAGRWLEKMLSAETLPKILCLRYNMGGHGQQLLQLFMRPEIFLNPRSKYELKAVLQTEFDPRGVCSCVSIKNDSISNFSVFGPISSKFISGKPPKSLTLLFELQTQWLLLEPMTTS